MSNQDPKPLPEAITKVVEQWVEDVRQTEFERAERDLDHAVKDTFPASDPIAPDSLRRRVEKLEDLEIKADGNELVVRVPVRSPGAASPPAPADEAEDCDPNDTSRAVKKDDLPVDLREIEGDPPDPTEGGRG